MNKDIMIGIGNRITNIRRSHKVTQEALAEMLDVSPKHISHVENACSCLSVQKFIEFCKIFDCSLDYIIFGNEGNDTLSKLPIGIVEILNTGSTSEQERLNRYLQMYLELREAKQK